MKDIIMQKVLEAIDEFKRCNEECADFVTNNPDDYQMIYQNSMLELW